MDGPDISQTSATGQTTDAGYRVLARKYRPSSFADLVGQEPMVQTLTNAFRTGRIAQAYMLTGVRGVGKTTTARILARALNYEIPGEIDAPTVDLASEGIHCRAIMEGRHVDVIEMDAASHTGIDDIREIIEAVRYKPASARYKVYIIDEIHMLSKAAFNGLLKTLEEPPPHVKFVFATTEIRKVPVTVLSRCQRFDLRRIGAGRLVDLMRGIAEQEGVQADDAALAMLARAGEGSARDALSLFDQAIAHAEDEVTADDVAAMLGLADRGMVLDLFENVMSGDAAAALGRIKALHDVGADPAVVLEDLAAFTHTVTRFKVAGASTDDDALTEEEASRGRAFAGKLSLRVLSRAWQMLLKGIEEARMASRPLAAADMVIVRIAHAANLPTPDEALRALASQPAAQPGAPPVSTSAAPTGAPTAAETTAAETTAAETTAAATTAGVAPSSAPRMAVSSGSAAQAARPEQHTEPSPHATVAEAPQGQLETFADLVALVDEHRDVRLKHTLETCVRIVRFEHGRIDMGLTEHAPSGFAGALGRALEEWTGTRWMIAVDRDADAMTIAEQRQAETDRLHDDARANPVVAAVMAAFPGAEIVDVRLAEMPEPAAVEADDDSDDSDTGET